MYTWIHLNKKIAFLKTGFENLALKLEKHPPFIQIF
jgi:hypothetical protein